MRLASPRLAAAHHRARPRPSPVAAERHVAVAEVPGDPVELTVPGDGDALVRAATPTPTADADATETPDAGTARGRRPPPSPRRPPHPTTGTEDGTGGGTEAPAGGRPPTTDQPPPAGSTRSSSRTTAPRTPAPADPRRAGRFPQGPSRRIWPITPDPGRHRPCAPQRTSAPTRRVRSRASPMRPHRRPRRGRCAAALDAAVQSLLGADRVRLLEITQDGRAPATRAEAERVPALRRPAVRHRAGPERPARRVAVPDALTSTEIVARPRRAARHRLRAVRPGHLGRRGPHGADRRLERAARHLARRRSSSAQLAADQAAAGFARLEADERRAAGSLQDRAVVRAARALNALAGPAGDPAHARARGRARARRRHVSGVYSATPSSGAVATAGYGVPEELARPPHRRPARAPPGRVLAAGQTVRQHTTTSSESASRAPRRQRAADRAGGPDGVGRRAARRAVGRLDDPPPRPRRGPAHARGDRRPGHRRLPQRRGLRARPARRPHRRADRRPQPRRDAGAHPRGDRPRAPRRAPARRRDPRPRRLQGRQRHPRPRGRRRAAAQGRPRAAGRAAPLRPGRPLRRRRVRAAAPRLRRGDDRRTSPSAAATRSAASARSASPPGTTASTPTGCSSRPTAR